MPQFSSPFSNSCITSCVWMECVHKPVHSVQQPHTQDWNTTLFMVYRQLYIAYSCWRKPWWWLYKFWCNQTNKKHKSIHWIIWDTYIFPVHGWEMTLYGLESLHRDLFLWFYVKDFNNNNNNHTNRCCFGTAGHKTSKHCLTELGAVWTDPIPLIIQHCCGFNGGHFWTGAHIGLSS